MTKLERGDEFKNQQKTIFKDSMLRRNKLMLEHVMWERQRDVQDHRIMEEINDQMREEKKNKQMERRMGKKGTNDNTI